MLITPTSHPGVRWLVWHVPRCCQVMRCLWVDDEACCYAVAEHPLRVVGDQVAYRVERARCIRVDVQAALILIDPIEDDAGETRGAVLELVDVSQMAAARPLGLSVVSSTRCPGAHQRATCGDSARGEGPGFGAAAGNGRRAFSWGQGGGAHGFIDAWHQLVRQQVTR